ncbi:hypothetical protein NADFUDRAFT_47574 [Nadsonia fulvescens var. elongata DSM 6958]|uniref:BRCT domain-containing protein n=1 Tax=Nadsonia fulvescens var. elongata DSM 6958 TaxID=857566 RepID=A0A1E3PGB6_9ASCO|nr:hypothetical protein NADFUDRAFT_47574 [Nadsonia fulvescens var. elongata DSM 6958]
MVEVSLTVGKLDASLALLLTKDHHLIEFPTILLPDDVEAGSIIKIVCEKDTRQEQREAEEFETVQDEILHTFGTKEPLSPVLWTKNITQTSVVLEWDPIEVGHSDVHSLTLYKNGSRVGIIPQPLTRTASKLSGLSIDAVYNFQLALATSAGLYLSNVLEFKTHKMTDLSGVTVCIGTIDESEGVTLEEIQESLKRIGSKPIQSEVKLDTTHFLCTAGVGSEWSKALQSNIPVVRPDWILACEYERRLVGVRSYYLDADPKTRPPVKRRADSIGSSAPTSRDVNLATPIPEKQQQAKPDATMHSSETYMSVISQDQQLSSPEQEPLQEEPLQEEPLQGESSEESNPITSLEKGEHRDLMLTLASTEPESHPASTLGLTSHTADNADVYADEYDSIDEEAANDENSNEPAVVTENLTNHAGEVNETANFAEFASSTADDRETEVTTPVISVPSSPIVGTPSSKHNRKKKNKK